MSKKNQCPICGYNNQPDNKLCSECGWYIPLKSENWLNDPLKKFGINLLRNIEKWAKKVWQRLEHNKERIKELEEKLTQPQSNIISLTEEKIPQIEEQITQLSANLDEKIDKKISSLFSYIDQYITEKIDLKIQQKMLEIIRLEQQQQKLFQKINQLEKQLLLTRQNQQDNIGRQTDVQTQLKIESTDPYCITPNKINNDSKPPQQSVQEEEWILDCYYQNTNQLLQLAHTVAVTETTINDIWKNKANQINFQISFDENEYWLLRFDESSNIYLVPSHNLRINTNSKVIKYIFKLNNFTITDEQNEYKLVKPAKVIASGKDTWRLIDKGILQF